MSKADVSVLEALKALKVSNAFARETKSDFFQKSLFQIAKLTFGLESQSAKAKEMIQLALSHDMFELQVDAYVLSGQIREVRLFWEILISFSECIINPLRFHSL